MVRNKIGAEGIIDVTFGRDGDDLIVVLVKDNGVGFATLKQDDSQL